LMNSEMPSITLDNDLLSLIKKQGNGYAIYDQDYNQFQAIL
jgi:hypothetical protein